MLLSVLVYGEILPVSFSLLLPSAFLLIFGELPPVPASPPLLFAYVVPPLVPFAASKPPPKDFKHWVMWL